MIFQQYTITLKAKPRGFHLIDDELLGACKAIKECTTGLLHAFIQHTSASLLINENADPSVRVDFESHTNVMVPENAPYYTHTYEGPDDMPAHIKASMFGTSISVPIKNGKLNLGTWQGIYLGEHRDCASGRTIVLTIQGLS